MMQKLTHPCFVTGTFAGVTINTYKVIYNLIDDVKAAMEGKLRTVEERQPLGSATVRIVVLSGLPGWHLLLQLLLKHVRGSVAICRSSNSSSSSGSALQSYC
jgi:hypothetical protein